MIRKLFILLALIGAISLAQATPVQAQLQSKMKAGRSTAPLPPDDPLNGFDGGEWRPRPAPFPSGPANPPIDVNSPVEPDTTVLVPAGLPAWFKTILAFTPFLGFLVWKYWEEAQQAEGR
jgi:hypothetical protein